MFQGFRFLVSYWIGPAGSRAAEDTGAFFNRKFPSGILIIFLWKNFYPAILTKSPANVT